MAHEWRPPTALGRAEDDNADDDNIPTFDPNTDMDKIMYLVMGRTMFQCPTFHLWGPDSEEYKQSVLKAQRRRGNALLNNDLSTSLGAITSSQEAKTNQATMRNDHVSVNREAIGINNANIASRSSDLNSHSSSSSTQEWCPPTALGQAEDDYNADDNILPTLDTSYMPYRDMDEIMEAKCGKTMFQCPTFNLWRPDSEEYKQSVLKAQRIRGNHNLDNIHLTDFQQKILNENQQLLNEIQQLRRILKNKQQQPQPHHQTYEPLQLMQTNAIAIPHPKAEIAIPPSSSSLSPVRANHNNSNSITTSSPTSKRIPQPPQPATSAPPISTARGNVRKKKTAVHQNRVNVTMKKTQLSSTKEATLRKRKHFSKGRHSTKQCAAAQQGGVWLKFPFETPNGVNIDEAARDLNVENGLGIPDLPDSQTIVTTKISLNQAEYKTLEPGEELNDLVIDFYLRWIVRKGTRSHSHIIRSLFYHMLERNVNTGDTSNIMKWSDNQDVNLFDKRIIMFPVNQEKSKHWSLCVVVNPGAIFNALDETNNDKKKPWPGIFFLDSYSCHCKPTAAKLVCAWLNLECKKRFDLSDNSSSAPLIRHLQEEGTNYNERYTNYPFNANTVEWLCPKVPMQENPFDCGVYTCRYAYAMYQLAERMVITYGNYKDELLIYSNEFAFNASNIDSMRVQLRLLLHRLKTMYENTKRSR